jgi:Mg2+/Co2+ transporter CorC
VQTEDQWGILLRHAVDVLKELRVLRAVRNLVVELSGCVEGIVWLEDVIIEPQLSIGDEKLTIKIVSDSATILHLTDHVLEGLP